MHDCGVPDYPAGEQGLQLQRRFERQARDAGRYDIDRFYVPKPGLRCITMKPTTHSGLSPAPASR